MVHAMLPVPTKCEYSDYKSNKNEHHWLVSKDKASHCSLPSYHSNEREHMSTVTCIRATQHFIEYFCVLCSLIQDTLVVTTVHYSDKKKEYKSFSHLKTDQSVFTVHVTSEITADDHADIKNNHNSGKRQRLATKVADHYSLPGLACKKIWSTIPIPSDVTYTYNGL
jgi:hypothetical protein